MNSNEKEMKLQKKEEIVSEILFGIICLPEQKHAVPTSNFIKPGSVWVLQDYERSSTTFGLKVFYLFSDNRNYLKPLVS